jgi:hypothetical protein
MIIKRWNGSAFVEEYPKTTTQMIVASADGETNIFDAGDKIKSQYLPNIVFDSLEFVGTVSSNTSLFAMIDAVNDATVASGGVLTPFTTEGNADSWRNIVGCYWVATATVTISFSATAAQLDTSGVWIKTRSAPNDEGTNGTTTTTLEAGDWIVITNYKEGNGSNSSNAYDIVAAVVNNTYEDATTALKGITRLSDATTYSSLTGNDVVTEGILKAVIDQASFAASGHAHGNITNTGTITSDTAIASGQKLVLVNGSNQVVRSALAIGTSTTTFLTEAGTWATPAGTYAHPTQTAINANATDNGINVIDSVTVNTLGHVTAVGTRDLSNATTAAAGVMSAADKTKLDGIATGANNYTHPTYTYSTPTADTQTTLSNIQLISTLAQTNGHVTGGTARKLVAGSNVTLTAASDGNITIASSFTNTTYSAKALGGLSLDGTQFQMVHPLFVQADAPSTPLTGTIWFDL